MAVWTWAWRALGRAVPRVMAQFGTGAPQVESLSQRDDLCFNQGFPETMGKLDLLHILSRLLSQPSGPPSPPVLLSEPPSSARTPPYPFNLTMSGATGRLRPRKEDSGSSTEDAIIARLPVGDGSVRDGTEHASSSGQIDFSWVADEPLEEESDFCDEAITAYAMVETISREDPPNWYCCAPKEEDRICHHVGLQVAPAGAVPTTSQRSRIYAGIRVSLPVPRPWLHPGSLLPRLPSPEVRFPWSPQLGFLQAARASVQDVRGFCSPFQKPVVRGDADYPGCPSLLYYYQREPNGEETLMSKIPLRWQRDHFDLSTAHYRVKYAMLGEEDRLAYKKLVDYVQSFSLGFWANRQGVPYLDEAGELITETRYINTKALLECDTEEEALALLSAMPNARDRVLKLANQVGAPDRVPKKKKKTAARVSETAGDAGVGPSQAASVIPSSPPRSNPINIPDSSPSPAASPLHKRKRPAGALTRSSPGSPNGPGSYLLPPCYVERSFFKAEESIVVPAPEAKAILDQDAAARRKDLARDIAAVIRVMETAMVLTDTSVSTASLEGALLQEGLSQKLEEVEKERDQLKAATASLEEQVADHQKLTEDNAGLRAQVASLEGKVRPLADETEEERALGSRGELLGHIQTLNQDLVACFKEGFDNAVEQLGLLNPELVTAGSAYNYCVRDGEIVCPFEVEEELGGEEEEEDEEGTDEVSGFVPVGIEARVRCSNPGPEAWVLPSRAGCPASLGTSTLSLGQDPNRRGGLCLLCDPGSFPGLVVPPWGFGDEERGRTCHVIGPVARFVADAVRAFPVGRQFALSRVFLVSSEDQGADLELSFYDFRVMA
ncbi:hypothetical protein KIW84_023132 [Lathyrus oleraceus]|uniref:Uncharacterized protein n=1 Tax=Pisum sativum TaxID=3888 RepID=A0A9D4YC70_PEA|nr:hypothetical protein KIW84_023132 [Pisum sativum]